MQPIRFLLPRRPRLRSGSITTCLRLGVTQATARRLIPGQQSLMRQRPCNWAPAAPRCTGPGNLHSHCNIKTAPGISLLSIQQIWNSFGQNRSVDYQNGPEPQWLKKSRQAKILCSRSDPGRIPKPAVPNMPPRTIKPLDG